jgi:hypothetical protein
MNEQLGASHRYPLVELLHSHVLLAEAVSTSRANHPSVSWRPQAERRPITLHERHRTLAGRSRSKAG